MQIEREQLQRRRCGARIGGKRDNMMYMGALIAAMVDQVDIMENFDGFDFECMYWSVFDKEYGHHVLKVDIFEGYNSKQLWHIFNFTWKLRRNLNKVNFEETSRMVFSSDLLLKWRRKL